MFEEFFDVDAAGEKWARPRDMAGAAYGSAVQSCYLEVGQPDSDTSLR